MIFILLPIYNEEKNLRAVLDDIADSLRGLKRAFGIVAVDDGSTDRTAEILRAAAAEFPLQVITFAANQGVGAVFRAGITEVCRKARDSDVLITMDCDRSHPAETFPRLLQAAEEGNDIVIASRYHPKSRTVGLPYQRKMCSNAVNAVLRRLFPLENARDYTTFFRAYSIEMLKRALRRYGADFIENPGFACIAEILLKLRSFNPRICEVPLELRFDLRTGPSKMKAAPAVKGYLWLIMRELSRKV